MIINYEPCPLCENTSYQQLFVIDKYPIILCLRCGLCRTKHDLHPIDFMQLYGTNYFKMSDPKRVGYANYYAMENTLRQNFRKRCRAVKKTIPKGFTKLFEIGTGPGFFLDECRKIGFDVEGIELSQDAVTFARETLNLNVTNSKIEDVKAKDKFDVICSWDTIEHVSDPNNFLNTVTNLLDENGYLFLSTGDRDSLVARISRSKWHLYTPPAHLFFFSKKTLSLLLKKHGFTVISVKYPIYSYTIAYLLEKGLAPINKTFGIPTPSVELLENHSLPFTLFDVMDITAVRTS